jgi:hypothetical protein
MINSKIAFTILIGLLLMASSLLFILGYIGAPSNTYTGSVEELSQHGSLQFVDSLVIYQIDYEILSHEQIKCLGAISENKEILILLPPKEE